MRKTLMKIARVGITFMLSLSLSVYAFDCLLGRMKRGASLLINRIFAMNDIMGLSTILSMHQRKAA